MTKSGSHGTRHLMLISSSMGPEGYLAHCSDDLVKFMNGAEEVCFIPYALRDWDRYEALAGERFQNWGVRLRSIHRAEDPREALSSSKVIFVGGGNTFVLLRELRRRGLLDAVREAVSSGKRYIGSSAGANIAAPNIRTTNDMPITHVRSLKSLGLVPFNINPHYAELDDKNATLGETRDERLLQFLEYNDAIVVALFSDSYLIVDGGSAWVLGGRGVRIFRRDSDAIDVPAGGRLDELLESKT